jgi:hypothetical protein
MNNSPEMITLSKEQRDALGALWQHYTAYIDVDGTEPVGLFGKHISSYLTILLVVAATQNSPDKAFTHVQNTAQQLKEHLFQTLHSAIGRTPSADDILQELAHAAPVPDPIADIIRQDFQHLQRHPPE